MYIYGPIEVHRYATAIFSVYMGAMYVLFCFVFVCFRQGKHYGVPGVNVDGQDMLQMLAAGRAVTEYVRSNGPAILQVGNICIYFDIEALALYVYKCTRECILRLYLFYIPGSS